MTREQLWYTRRGTQIRGPYHAGLIRRYLILGRLSESDEASVDKQAWTPISLIPEFTIEILQSQAEDPTARERLLAAKRWADERLGRERRDGNTPAGEGVPEERRRRGERRSEEPDDLLRHRTNRVQRAAGTSREPRRALGLLVVLMIGGGLIGLIFTLKPPGAAKGPDCTAAPAPRVNWANCHFEGRQLTALDLRGANLHNADLSGVDLAGSNLAGADLAFAKLRQADLGNTNLSKARLKGANLTAANLAGADLRRADLSYAILRRANLTGAALTGANLVNAIWVNSAVCGRDSLGGCRAAGR